MEIRNPDPCCNPYLAFSLLIKAGLNGVLNKVDPGDPIQKNVYLMSQAERSLENIQSLPESLIDALVEMEKDPLCRETLGEHILYRFLEAKYIEWEVYKNQVHQWELDQYLGVF